jgi:hypothetical protein
MIDPNRLRIPPRKSAAFAAGWRACEAGATPADNPYRPPTIADRPGVDYHAWTEGFARRAETGFETAHLPRKPFSDAFAF